MKTLNQKDLLSIYEYMLTARLFEEKVIPIYASNTEVPGSIHLGVGEEGVSVGAAFGLRKGDFVSPTHRTIGAMIARDIDVDALMAEWFGKVSGINKGRSGSTHVGDLERGILPINAIVGANVPIATGVAFSFMVEKKDNVVVVYCGDGSTSTGNFHEGLNLAGAYKLPLVVVCDNNFFAMSTPSSLLPVEHMADRAGAYGMPGVTIDGNDVLKVHQTVQKAVERARRGEGPSLIECETYRFCGHSQHDADTLRKSEDKQKWMENCPIKRFEQTLIAKGETKETLGGIRDAVDKKIDDAIAFARSSELPGRELILQDVYKANNLR